LVPNTSRRSTREVHPEILDKRLAARRCDKLINVVCRPKFLPAVDTLGASSLLVKLGLKFESTTFEVRNDSGVPPMLEI
jgi:hypothetical protein